MKYLNLLILVYLLKGQLVTAQVTEVEFRETRSFAGTTNNYGTTYNVFNYIGSTNTVVLSAGKKMSILEVYQNANGSHASTLALEVQYTNSANKFRLHESVAANANITPSPSPVGKTFIGPCTVNFCLIGNQMWVNPSVNVATDSFYNPHVFFWRYEISDYGSINGSGSGLSLSSSSVVVPSNANGDVDVLLEQSTDMITWTQCLPGTYNASTQKRFFRVRAEEK